jgi:CubicO group peptidase (beta-lactamase class C family)
MIEITKTLKPRFALRGEKAYYSDLNFQLLGEVVEKVTQMPLEEVFQNYLFKPLGLTKTYVPTGDDFVPNIYYKNQSIHRPKLLMSLRGGGVAITTARELMMFLKAFFNGNFFPKSLFKQLSNYRKLQITMGPLYYGGGYMQIPMNSIYTLFTGKGELLGHSGHSGSFAFYYQHKNLFFVGDTNQLANPGLPIMLVMKLAHAVK